MHTHTHIHTQKFVPKAVQYRRPQKENFPATPQAPQGDHPLQTQMRYSFCPLQYGTSTEERLPTFGKLGRNQNRTARDSGLFSKKKCTL